MNFQDLKENHTYYLPVTILKLIPQDPANPADTPYPPYVQLWDGTRHHIGQDTYKHLIAPKEITHL